jgi:hypothetical protein
VPNDAKSCYDLIGHPQASLAMQRCGVPKSILKCLFSQLQNATHQVRTGYGDSSSCYGGSNWAKPYHGIGQGNGAGPAIWAVISSPLLNLLRKKGFHCHFVAPLSSIDIKFSGYSFVDDTDLVIVKLSRGTYEEIITALQKSVDTWERGLNATSGAIVAEKTFWFLIDFAWKAGQWRYKSIEESPGKLYANDIHGNRVSLRRYEAHEAQETLGVFLAPDGNHRAQIAKMLQVSQKWADAMRSGCLSRSDVRLSLISTIWKTLLYPLPALNLTKEECEKLMAPILQYCLPAMGFCRNFPRDIVFAPISCMGVGIEHLYTIQEIMRLKDLVYHTTYDTDTGNLYRISLEILLIEVGISANLSELNYDQLSGMATPSLVKSTWKFLHENSIHLEHDLQLWPPRSQDQLIMVLILQVNPSISELLSFNRCRLFLQALFVSDLADGFGGHLSDDAWLGRRHAPTRSASWPTQGSPTSTDWNIWRSLLSRALLSRGRRLKQPLGPWLLEDEHHKWYIEPSSEQLHSKIGNKCYCHPRIPRRSGRPSYSSKGFSCSPPVRPHRAQIYTKGTSVICIGHSPLIPSTLPRCHTFKDFLLASTDVTAHWCFQSMIMTTDYFWPTPFEIWSIQWKS